MVNFMSKEFNKQNTKAIDYNTSSYVLPDQIYEEAITANNFSLKKFTGLDIYMVGDMKTVRLFRKYNDLEQTIAISLNIPYYDKNYPEKMEATRFFNMFAVFEYTKREAYTTKEIDWNIFKEKFNKCLLKISNILDVTCI